MQFTGNWYASGDPPADSDDDDDDDSDTAANTGWSGGRPTKNQKNQGTTRPTDTTAAETWKTQEHYVVEGSLYSRPAAPYRDAPSSVEAATGSEAVRTCDATTTTGAKGDYAGAKAARCDSGKQQSRADAARGDHQQLTTTTTTTATTPESRDRDDVRAVVMRNAPYATPHRA